MKSNAVSLFEAPGTKKGCMHYDFYLSGSQMFLTRYFCGEDKKKMEFSDRCTSSFR